MTEGQRIVTGETVRISELATADRPAVEGTEFRQCRIEGPAVLILPPDERALSDCDLGSTLDSLFWEIPHTRQFVLGGIFVRNTLFHQCTFHGVGFAGFPELRQAFERNTA